MTPQTCMVCGYEIKPPIEHTHNYEEWRHDSTQHWKVCSCGEETGRENHDFGDWVIDKEATATEEGTKHRECQTCQYREEETIPKLPVTESSANLTSTTPESSVDPTQTDLETVETQTFEVTQNAHPIRNFFSSLFK